MRKRPPLPSQPCRWSSPARQCLDSIESFGNGSRVGDDLIAVPHIQCDLVRIGITTGGFNFGDILANRLGKLGHYFDYLWQLFFGEASKMG